MKAIVDCNNFYCSCERVFRPELDKKPVAVLSNNDGCIIAMSNEVKDLGVNMASPVFKYRDLIREHDITLFSSNYNLYGDMSRRVMETVSTIEGIREIEVYSVDEAFLDMSEMHREDLYKTGCRMIETIERWTGIKVSVGMAPSKVLSKLANRMVKKMRLSPSVMIIDSEEMIEDALRNTRIEDIWGIGRRYASRLSDTWNIRTAWQLRNMPEEWVRRELGGVVGQRLLRELRGEACIPMKPPLEEKIMIATTRMFGRPVTTLGELREAIASYTARAAEKLRRQRSAAGMINVFLMTNDYEREYRYNPRIIEKSATLPVASSATGELIRYALPLADQLFSEGSRYLKAGVVLTRLEPEGSVQGNLFSPSPKQPEGELMSAMDNINFSMRNDVVKYAAAGQSRNWTMKREMISPRYTTRWEELRKVE